MTTKRRMQSLSGRPDSHNEEIRIQGYPSFSSRKEFYSQYLEQRNNSQEIQVADTDCFIENAISEDEETRFYNYLAGGRNEPWEA